MMFWKTGCNCLPGCMGKADSKRTDGKVNKCIRGNLLLSVERSADDSRFIFLSGKSKFFHFNAENAISLKTHLLCGIIIIVYLY